MLAYTLTVHKLVDVFGYPEVTHPLLDIYNPFISIRASITITPH